MADRPLDALRGLTYRFLALLYLHEPDAAWLAGLAREGLFSDFPYPAQDERTVKGLALLADACGRLTFGDPQAAGAAFRADYDRLFVGPDHLPAPPWESVYRGEERLVFDWPTLEVRETYRRMGLATEKGEEPDDHIGLELLFMAILSERAAQGDDNAAMIRQEFMQEHLLRWAPRFCDHVREYARSDLYRGLALLTSGVLAQECDMLAGQGERMEEWR